MKKKCPDCGMRIPGNRCEICTESRGYEVIAIVVMLLLIVVGLVMWVLE